MDVSALSQALNSNVTSSAQSAAAGKQLSGTFDTFLKLLTSQLKNQDPLKPMDSSEFTQQLVSYSQVEQQINTNKNLESLVSSMQAASFAGAIGYIGKTIEAEGNAGGLKAGGSIDWIYELDGAAAATKLTVSDKDGKTILTKTGDNGAGRHDFKWDGKDSSGKVMPAGSYTLTVTAADASGKSIASTIFRTGVVEGVETMDGVQQLIVGGQAVPIADVTSVRQVATN